VALFAVCVNSSAIPKVGNVLTMPGKLVLMTGSTGHIGYHCLIEALSKGYKVRVAVRSAEKFATIAASKCIQPYLTQICECIVPDITKEGAFDEAVKGVDYVVHIASPLGRSTNDFENTIIKPAVSATISILESAMKQPSIMKVVITSSSSVGAPPPPVSVMFTPNDTTAIPPGPYPSPFAAYMASKKLAHKATQDFINDRKPFFNVINIMPSIVLGPNPLITRKEDLLNSSNRTLFVPLLGQTIVGGPAMYAHVSDVAYVHIAALSEEIKGNHNFGVSTKTPNEHEWDDSLGIVKEAFPQAIESGLLPLGGSVKSLPGLYDCSATEETLGIKFKEFPDMVRDAVGQYLALAAKEQNGSM
jgi:nucleoside-diphosphate-sugar epimerase